MRITPVLLVLLALAVSSIYATTPNFKISTDTQYNLIDQYGDSKLYSVSGSFEYTHAPMV